MVRRPLRERLFGLAARAGAVVPDLDPAVVEARYANDASRFVDVDGVRVHYRDEGPRDVPILLLVHGTFASLHTWEGWVERLADEYRLVRLDLPGHGLTGPYDGGYRMHHLVEFLESFRETLGLERFTVVGNSRGGEVAWRYALDHPDRVEGLVLVDSMGYRMGGRPEIERAASYWGVQRLFRWFTPRVLVRRSLRQVYGDPDLVDRTLVDRYRDLMCRAGNREAFVAIVRRDLDPWYRYDELGDVDVPTLVLWGEADEWLPLSWGYRFESDVPDAELVTYPGVGHTPMEEVPERSACDLRAFLESRVGQPTEEDPSQPG